MADKEVDLNPPEAITSFKETYWKETRELKKGKHNEKITFNVTVPEKKKYILTVVATLSGAEDTTK